MPIPKSLYDIIVCPKDKSKLIYNKDKTSLVCTKCKKEYPIKDGIVMML